MALTLTLIILDITKTSSNECNCLLMTSLKMLVTSNKRSLSTYFAHCIIACLVALEVIAKRSQKQKSLYSTRTGLTLGPPDRQFKKIQQQWDHCLTRINEHDNGYNTWVIILGTFLCHLGQNNNVK